MNQCCILIMGETVAIDPHMLIMGETVLFQPSLRFITSLCQRLILRLVFAFLIYQKKKNIVWLPDIMFS